MRPLLQIALFHLISAPLSAQEPTDHKSLLHFHWMPWSTYGNSETGWLGNALPDANLHADVFNPLRVEGSYQFHQHWMAGFGVSRFKQSADMFVETSRTVTSSSWLSSSTRITGNGHGLRQDLLLFGPSITFEPWMRRTDEICSFVLNGIIAARFAQFTEEQMVQPGQQYGYSGGLFGGSGAPYALSMAPADAVRTTTGVLCEFVLRGQIFFGRHVSMVMDAGTIIGPTLHVEGYAETDLYTATTASIPAHAVDLNGAYVSGGIGLHW